MEQEPQETRPDPKPAPKPEVVGRRLRSRLPVSPLPWRWSRRLRYAALIGVIVLVGGGAIAWVLLQGNDDSDGGDASTSAAAKADKLLRGMSVAEKADAVLVTGFADPDRLPVSRAGGILVTADSWPGEAKGKALTSKLRDSGGRIPPLIVAQQEGGDFRALPDLPPAEGEPEVGAIGTAAAAETWALATGKALEANGIDLNLAPVADVATLDSPLADRVFGDDPALVSALTTGAVRGCRKARIACAVSSFPGQGGASADPASGPATVSLDADSLEARDLPPFRAAFKQKVPAVVLSLAFYAAYDPVTPAALSPIIADELLRERLGYKGLALTGDLSSGAISVAQGAPSAAAEALAAGADMVVISGPGQAAKASKTVRKAAEDGSVPMERLDEAVARVLALKRRLGIL